MIIAIIDHPLHAFLFFIPFFDADGAFSMLSNIQCFKGKYTTTGTNLLKYKDNVIESIMVNTS